VLARAAHRDLLNRHPQITLRSLEKNSPE